MYRFLICKLLQSNGNIDVSPNNLQSTIDTTCDTTYNISRRYH